MLKLLGSRAPRRITVKYADIMGCEEGCEVAAAGFPDHIIAHYPGLSPVGSADLTGALLGIDRILWGRAAAAFAFWAAVSLLIVRGVAWVQFARRLR